MYVRFFETPNNDVFESGLMSLDSIRIQGLLQALPTAIVASLEHNAVRDLDEEQRRIHLNGAITLADVLIEIADTIIANRSIIPTLELSVMLQRAEEALHRLQDAKDVRIAAIHAELGENFGSATGFQKHNYRNDAFRYRGWIVDQGGKA